MAFWAFFGRGFGSTKFTNYASENKNSNKLFSFSIVGLVFLAFQFLLSSILVFNFRFLQNFNLNNLELTSQHWYLQIVKLLWFQQPCFSSKSFDFLQFDRFFSLLLFFPGFLYATKTPSKSRNLFHFSTNFSVFWGCFRKVLPENNRTYVWQVASKSKQEKYC